MKNTIILLSICLLVSISCRSNSHEPVVAAETNEANETIDVSKGTGSLLDITDESNTLYGLRKAIINADCDYYVRDENEPAGRLLQGQEILIGEYYYLRGRFDVDVEIKTIDRTISGYVSQRYITYPDGPTHDLWCKNMLLTREYYYKAPVEDIFNNDYGKDIRPGNAERKRVIQLWRAFYSEMRLFIFENYIAYGIDEDGGVYRIESVKKNGNVYTFFLSQCPRGKFEITLVDEGDGITITQYTVRETLLLDDVSNILNFKYMPQDKEKSEKTKVAVYEWCNEQLEILDSQNEP